MANREKIHGKFSIGVPPLGLFTPSLLVYPFGNRHIASMLVEDNMTVLSVDDLAKAIQNSVEGKKIEEKDAKKMAEHVLNFFGYSDRIIDNILEPEDRDVFYMLEDSGILVTEREETTLYDGREWRIHYWLFQRDVIEKLLEGVRKKAKKEAEASTVYDELFSEDSTLPEDIWIRG